MVVKDGIRPGGRSARVQAAVHAATRELLARMDRAELTIPMIAAAAGVTPSTIYRRWHDLPSLLADVAVARLRPDAEPARTGTLRGDLDAWLEQYVDEICSAPGRAMTADALACDPRDRNAGSCAAYIRQQLEAIVGRAAERGEPVPGLDALMDHVVAPVVYRIVFGHETVAPAFWRGLLDRVLAETKR
ncbi:TetR/AcrR family transcriptional regulator [Rhodovastum atsumiense]|uniref:TetR/AcrR family transcriptional regulator n=1 Tax=Rhodovastum atsumiense TaxID=504468 RepID=A0A5M6IMI7_9PROT|nr:TetR/AcrR family transcriptional regulator [Rhodovastum atsumiense]KAA5609069.1 TetR/AcrR family transcriptional regulator [Rhodovastum atsumiense]CAH2602180.1 TetR/AcrR family transcriptional regulator [Rhodovastum atsumiense]